MKPSQEQVKLVVGLIRSAASEEEAVESMNRILEGFQERMTEEQPKVTIQASTKCKGCGDPVKLCAKCHLKGRAESLARKGIANVSTKAIEKAPDALAWLNKILFSEE